MSKGIPCVLFVVTAHGCHWLQSFVYNAWQAP